MNTQTLLALLIASLPVIAEAAPARYLDESDALRVIAARSPEEARLAELDALCKADATASAPIAGEPRRSEPSATAWATRLSESSHGRRDRQDDDRRAGGHDAGHGGRHAANDDLDDDHGHQGHHDGAHYHGTETLPQANPVAAVPLPASAWLLAVGLFGLIGQRIRGGRQASGVRVAPAGVTGLQAA